MTTAPPSGVTRSALQGCNGLTPPPRRQRQRLRRPIKRPAYRRRSEPQQLGGSSLCDHKQSRDQRRGLQSRAGTRPCLAAWLRGDVISPSIGAYAGLHLARQQALHREGHFLQPLTSDSSSKPEVIRHAAQRACSADLHLAGKGLVRQAPYTVPCTCRGSQATLSGEGFRPAW